jgi:hypothetical protein
VIIEIKNRWNGLLQLGVEIGSEYESASLGLRLGAAVKLALVNKHVLRDAVLSDADLSGADLSGADLRDAVLRGAVLCGADLRGAKILTIGSVKHSLYFVHPDTIVVGCQQHSIAEWREQIDKIGVENGYSPLEIEVYKLHIEHLARVAQLLWPAEKGGSAA